jgi:hypothetical protein
MGDPHFFLYFDEPKFFVSMGRNGSRWAYRACFHGAGAKRGEGVGVSGFAGLHFGLPRNGGEGDLGGVEEFGAILFADGAGEHAVAGAGDVIADVLIPAERRHGLAEGFPGTALRAVFSFVLLQRGLVDLFPCAGAESDGGIFEGGVVEVFREQVGRGLDGFSSRETSGKAWFRAYQERFSRREWRARSLRLWVAST